MCSKKVPEPRTPPLSPRAWGAGWAWWWVSGVQGRAEKTHGGGGSWKPRSRPAGACSGSRRGRHSGEPALAQAPRSDSPAERALTATGRWGMRLQGSRRERRSPDADAPNLFFSLFFFMRPVLDWGSGCATQDSLHIWLTMRSQQAALCLCYSFTLQCVSPGTD